MNKPKKYKSQTDESDINSINEPIAEFTRKKMQEITNPASIPGQYTDKEFMEYLDKAEKRIEDGKGISHDEALKMIQSWE